jgi:hypothetical protein
VDSTESVFPSAGLALKDVVLASNEFVDIDLQILLSGKIP